jgi:hypothetical protein
MNKTETKMMIERLRQTRTVEELARHLKLSKDVIYRVCNQGSIGKRSLKKIEDAYLKEVSHESETN